MPIIGDEFRSDGFVIFEIDCSAISTKEQLLGAVATEMQFPAYFGGNWDALEECLRDMTWLPANGYLLILRSAEQLWRQNARLAAGMVTSWHVSAEQWSHRRIPFHLIFVW